MSKGTYQKALEEIDPVAHASTIDLHLLAEDCDSLRKKIVSNCRHAEKVFAAIGDEMESGHTFSDNPIGFQSVYETPVLIGKLVAQKDMFWKLAYVLLGEERYRLLIATVKTAHN